MPSIILDVYCNDEYNYEYPSKAKIELNKERIEEILKLNEAVLNLKVLKICDWDNIGMWLASDPEEDEEEEEWEGRVECEEFSVYDSTVSWSAIIKHTNIEISTDSISMEELREIKSVYDTPGENLPLFIENLKYDSSKELLSERLKKE